MSVARKTDEWAACGIQEKNLEFVMLPLEASEAAGIRTRFWFLEEFAKRRMQSKNLRIGETVMLYEKMKDFTVAGGDVSGLRSDRLTVSRQ